MDITTIQQSRDQQMNVNRSPEILFSKIELQSKIGEIFSQLVEGLDRTVNYDFLSQLTFL